MYNFINRKNGVLVTNGDESYSIEFLYQPIFSECQNHIRFYEVLSKVTDLESGELNTQDFFTCANDDLIKGLCLSQISIAKQNKIDACVSMNINLSCLSDTVFVDNLIALSDAGFALEINEINCYTECDNTLANLVRLQESGIMIWLDDYHANNAQANLTFGKIAWDFIKIDKGFLYHNSDNYCAIRSLAYVLKPYSHHGLIFEGVETPEQARMVSSFSALGQGYYLSMPISWGSTQDSTLDNSHLNLSSVE